MKTIYLNRIYPSKSTIGTYGWLVVGNKKFRTAEPRKPIIRAPHSYTVTWTWSPKFNRKMPLINGVFGHSAVRIHPGNNPITDTSGCVLIGKSIANGLLTSSRKAFNEFVELVGYEPFTLEVTNIFV